MHEDPVVHGETASPPRRLGVGPALCPPIVDLLRYLLAWHP
jgi:hypothetical protein